MSCEKERYHLVNLGKIQAENFLNKLEETRCNERNTILVNQEGEAQASITTLVNQEEEREGEGEAQASITTLVNQEEERQEEAEDSITTLVNQVEE